MKDARNETSAKNVHSGSAKPSRKPSRRDFLVATAAGGAGLLMGAAAMAQEEAESAAAAPASESLAPAVAPSSNDLNIAMIGLGAEGMILMESILRIPGIRVKAICDIWEYSQRRASGTLRKYGHEHNLYVDYRELLTNEKDLDAVIVATPDFMHAEHTIACLKAGLHVYCEKEMANTIEGAKRMLLAQRETGKLLQIGHQRRSNPRYLNAIGSLVREHRLLDRITHANAQWNRAKSEDLGWPKRYEIDPATLAKYGYDSMHHFRNWRWYRKYGGGPVVDLGSHQIDIFNWVFGAPPRSVVASGGIDYYTQHEWFDNVLAIYEYDTPEGVSRAFYQVLTTSSNGGFYETFMGVNGTLVISEVPMRGNHFLKEVHAPDDPWNKLVAAGLLSKPDETAVAAAPTKDTFVDVRVTKRLGSWDLTLQLNKPAHQPHLENFFDAVRTGVPLNCPADIGYETAVCVLKANAAVEAGTRLPFLPEEFQA
ncbi:MAG TPA: Gfo/Idh/MocA family oxidoreductase [Candidatus Hydrogenedentes bacterium]|nr:Gfo/Idh/MocA family oxidoreductase [Candidatus Hydrogenedentota bacterium]HOS02166.1 Gfo/Idh/MocA family oxidoreductase [Candidatus Hydrogenedentota bacterium]